MDIKREIWTEFLVLCLGWHFSLLNISGSFAAADTEPIAYIGHGAFFDGEGKQVDLTQDLIERAQAYYRQRLLSSMPSDKSAIFSDIEKRLGQTLTSSRQNRLVLENRFIGSLVPNSSDPDANRIASILNALEYAMRLQIPEHAETVAPIRRFVPDPQVRDLIEKQSFSSQPVQTLASTLNGAQYIESCRKNGVPIPPPANKLDPAGTAGWKSLGFIQKSDLFIVTKQPAELRVFKSASPEGMCFALPRYTDDTMQTVALDGMICLGKSSSKVCIWDNQMPVSDGIGGAQGKGFEFSAKEQIPIGVPDLKVDSKGRYQGGGNDLNKGSGGVCTDCHAGENPYIIHPNANLGGGIRMGELMGFPTFSDNRYDPIVPGSWPQNNTSAPETSVPSTCGECHTKGGDAGRFPQLSRMYRSYCVTILRLALDKTMPPKRPGSLKTDTEVEEFLNHCADDPPKVTTSDPKP